MGSYFDPLYVLSYQGDVFSHSNINYSQFTLRSFTVRHLLAVLSRPRSSNPCHALRFNGKRQLQVFQSKSCPLTQKRSYTGADHFQHLTDQESLQTNGGREFKSFPTVKF